MNLRLREWSRPQPDLCSDVPLVLQYFFSDIAAANSVHNVSEASKLVDAVGTLDTKHDDILICNELVFKGSIKFLQQGLFN